MTEWQPIETAPEYEVVLVAWDDRNIDWDFCTAAKRNGIWSRAGGSHEVVRPQWWACVKPPSG